MLIILFPRNLAKDHDVIRDEARELLQQVQAKAVEYDSDRKVCDISFFLLHAKVRMMPYTSCTVRAGAYIHLLLRFRDADHELTIDVPSFTSPFPRSDLVSSPL